MRKSREFGQEKSSTTRRSGRFCMGSSDRSEVSCKCRKREERSKGGTLALEETDEVPSRHKQTKRALERGVRSDERPEDALAKGCNCSDKSWLHERFETATEASTRLDPPGNGSTNGQPSAIKPHGERAFVRLAMANRKNYHTKD